jgi:hypothetical protein
MPVAAGLRWLKSAARGRAAHTHTHTPGAKTWQGRGHPIKGGRPTAPSSNLSTHHAQLLRTPGTTTGHPLRGAVAEHLIPARRQAGVRKGASDGGHCEDAGLIVQKSVSGAPPTSGTPHGDGRASHKARLFHFCGPAPYGNELP